MLDYQKTRSGHESALRSFWHPAKYVSELSWPCRTYPRADFPCYIASCALLFFSPSSRRTTPSTMPRRFNIRPLRKHMRERRSTEGFSRGARRATSASTLSAGRRISAEVLDERPQPTASAPTATRQIAAHQYQNPDPAEDSELATPPILTRRLRRSLSYGDCIAARSLEGCLVWMAQAQVQKCTDVMKRSKYFIEATACSYVILESPCPCLRLKRSSTALMTFLWAPVKQHFILLHRSL